ncbi:MAG: chorismate-binding protein, partial [Dissulfurimicrobium sp.]
SPELFLRRDGDEIMMRPMKGTARRGRSIQEDAEIAVWLKSDVKNRAENVMIVDLIRNDLGRIARSGGVYVKDLFRVERYETLLQMTSTVKAHVPHKTPWSEVFAALFPSGSVTGAPKLRTMEIISELETSPRGIYTGAIGFISPNDKAVLNVAIRSVVLDGEAGEVGVGSGITADSDPGAEYDECLLKFRFLTSCLRQKGESDAQLRQAAPLDFSLIETIRLDDEGYVLLERHLERLSASAHYFSFRCDVAAVKKGLLDLAEGLKKDTGPYKVRLLLERSGSFSLDYSPIEPVTGPVRIVLSKRHVDSMDHFLYHKTNFRPLYEEEHGKVVRDGFFDCIFTNERGELTEGSVTNIFVETEEGLFTPPIESGLLNGVLRAELLAKGRAIEKVLYPPDLMTAKAVYVGNSVRGLIRASL